MALARKNLSVVKQYAIDLITKDTYTYSVQISHLKDLERTAILDLPIDPVDNTLAAVLDKHSVAQLGDDAEFVLQELASVLEAHIGAKEFIVRPAQTNLPGFVPAQDEPKCNRIRHANRLKLQSSAEKILNEYPQLVAELDKSMQFIVGAPEIISHLGHSKPYDEISALMEGHSDFTPGKMTEYKDEDINGKIARFNNERIRVIGMINTNGRLCGLIRCFAMGNFFGYLSDETINQELVNFLAFAGVSDEEKKVNRNKFLLAYLISHTCRLMIDQKSFLMIAADKRVGIYEAVGLEPLPLQSADYVVTSKFGMPGLQLKQIKEKLINPASVSQLSLMNANPAVSTVVAEEKMQVPGLKGKK